MKSVSKWILLLLKTLLLYVSDAVDPRCQCLIFESVPNSEKHVGTFTSPSFPAFYPSNISCILYTFIGSNRDEIVEITFLNFDLQIPSSSKCTDFLRFFVDLPRPEISERTAYQYEMCGNITMIQKIHYSSGRSLILEFHSDKHNGSNTGFKGQFRFLNKKHFETNGIKSFSSECDYKFQPSVNKSGKFFSPKYPQNYPPKSLCKYIFMGDDKHMINLRFENILLQNYDGDCYSSPDAIIIYKDMNIEKAAPIRCLNNLGNNIEISSPGRLLVVVFKSDQGHQQKGFAARYQFRDKPYKNGINPTDDFHYSTRRPTDNNHGNELSPSPVTQRPFTSDCVKTFKSEEGKQGTFTSPRYPAEYSSGQQCKYEFIGNPEERVQIIFEEVQLYYVSNNAEDPTECTSVDSIRVQIKDEGELKDIGIFCGKMDNRKLMSPDQFMEVIFDSVERDASSTKAPFKGFKASYKFLTNFGIDTGIQDKANKCIFTFTSRQAKSGMFTSPNYPGDYPRNTVCQYVFKGEMKEEEIVHIHFLTFSVEGIKPCTEETKSDSVSFSNFGFRISDRKMSKLCGNILSADQRTVTSDGPYFRVIFKSNSVYDDKGFEASYQFKKKKDNNHQQSAENNRYMNNPAASFRSRINSLVFFVFFLLVLC